jgi:hypothetical protein
MGLQKGILMHDESIGSPPYPKESSTADMLYQSLLELQDWVRSNREELNEHADTDVVPKTTKLGRREAYLLQPVMLQFQQFVMMRKLREEWDHLLRSYEDAWNSEACIRQRMLLVRTAALMCNDAALPQEHREARNQAHQERLQRNFEKFASFVDGVIEREDHTADHKRKRRDNN